MILITKLSVILYNYYCKFILLFAIFLQACTFNKQLIAKKNNSINNILWINHQQQLAKLTKFKISGIFTYIAKDNKIYARFFWEQYTLYDYRLLLINPLGIIELELNVTPYLIKVIDRKGKKYVDDNQFQLIYKLTGIEIPIKNLSYWLIGLPTNATSFTLDRNGLLKTIKYVQNNKIWNLNYLTYHEIDKFKLPSRIELIKDNQCIKLRINNWIIKK
ncbi:MAG: lipoprotein insertase outer membrane protein LolB [Arsenophonus sp.]